MLKEEAKKAAQVSIVISLLELAIIFLFKKVLFSMWILILTLQFFVYMATWQIRYPKLIRFILFELKKIALGEFLDDFGFGETIMTTIGLEPSNDSPTDEKLGEERLGSTNPFASQGLTMLLGSFIFLLIILVVVAAMIIVKKRGASQKCQKLLKSVKKKIFFNPIVRYMILNCLKLSISGVLSLKAAAILGDASLIVPILLVAVITLTPVVFFKVLYQN